MHHIVYVSTATRPFTPADAERVLADARAFNAARGVTGLLVHTSSGGFLQVLEGERDDVEAVFARVATSSRHTALLRTPALEVGRRAFPEWSMGFEQAVPGVLAELVLQPLVDHRLVGPDQVRAALLQRWHVRAA